jgi:hypothetical protein
MAVLDPARPPPGPPGRTRRRPPKGTNYWPLTLDFHPNDDVFYGHVLGFKVLERSAVVLCVNGFKDMERAAEQLYVRLSRARSLLVVVGTLHCWRALAAGT